MNFRGSVCLGKRWLLQEEVTGALKHNALHATIEGLPLLFFTKKRPSYHWRRRRRGNHKGIGWDGCSLRSRVIPRKKYTERLGFKSRVVKVKKYCGNNSQKERRCAYEAPTSLFQGKNRPNSLRKNLLKFASRARRLKIRQNTARQKLFLRSFFGVVTCMK